MISDERLAEIEARSKRVYNKANEAHYYADDAPKEREIAAEWLAVAQANLDLLAALRAERERVAVLLALLQGAGKPTPPGPVWGALDFYRTPSVYETDEAGFCAIEADNHGAAARHALDALDAARAALAALNAAATREVGA